MSRAKAILERFKIGSTVVVGDVLPNRSEWPGVNDEMHQFFCGQELEVIDHVFHPDYPDRIALRLNTKVEGASKNHAFSVDWVSLASDDRLEVRQVKKGRRIKSSEVKQVGYESESKAKEMTRQARIAEENFWKQAKPKEPEVITEEKPKPKEEVSWATALGGAFVTALGIAATKKIRANSEASKGESKISVLAEPQKVVEEETVEVTVIR